MLRAIPRFFWKYANSNRKTNIGISELKSKKNDNRKGKSGSSVFTIEPECDLPLMHPIDVKQECIQKLSMKVKY